MKTSPGSHARKYGAMFESASQPILLVSLDGSVRPNARAASLFAMTPGAGAGELSELFPPRQPDGHDSARMAWRARAARSGWPQVFKARFRRLDGVLFDSHVSLALAEWDGPQTLSATVSPCAPWDGEDARLVELAQRSRTREAVARLAGGVAHDFNNLLTIIIGHAQLLGMRKRDAEDREALAEIERAALRAAHIARRLLAYSGREAGAQRRLDLNEVVLGVHDRLQALMEGTRITMRLSPCLGMVTADPLRMEQAIMAVALNAKQAMPRGGTLALETCTLLAATRTWTALSISDAGPGMRPEVCARAFEPYFSTRESGVGMGLGLAVVDGIMRQSGGHVEARSRPGRGTTVTLYLPRV
jgi:two-component system, chemotaxis family, CheB/CheR fusion protein